MSEVDDSDPSRPGREGGPVAWRPGIHQLPAAAQPPSAMVMVHLPPDILPPDNADDDCFCDVTTPHISSCAGRLFSCPRIDMDLALAGSLCTYRTEYQVCCCYTARGRTSTVTYRCSSGLARFQGSRWGWAPVLYSNLLHSITTSLHQPPEWKMPWKMPLCQTTSQANRHCPSYQAPSTSGGGCITASAANANTPAPMDTTVISTTPLFSLIRPLLNCLCRTISSRLP
jgi:hypothetical protein